MKITQIKSQRLSDNYLDLNDFSKKNCFEFIVRVIVVVAVVITH